MKCLIFNKIANAVINDQKFVNFLPSEPDFI